MKTVFLTVNSRTGHSTATSMATNTPPAPKVPEPRGKPLTAREARARLADSEARGADPELIENDRTLLAFAERRESEEAAARVAARHYPRIY